LKPFPALLFALFGGGTAADLASQAPYGRHDPVFDARPHFSDYATEDVRFKQRL
jgi:hypothetical protein